MCATCAQQKSTDKATGSRQRTEFSAKCYRCGGAHDAQACRFISERCRYCQRIDHIERVCRKKYSECRTDRGRNRRSRKRTPDRVQSHAVTEQRETLCSRTCADMYSLNTLTSNVKNPLVAKVLINGKPLIMEIDSGSACSLISDRVFHKLKLQNVRQMYPAKILCTWSKEQFDVRSQVEFEVRFNGRKCRLPLLVVNRFGASLLGRDWFQALGISVVGIHQVCHGHADSVLSRYPLDEDMNAYKGPLGDTRFVIA
ncbi:hypothetical protein M514_04346 [Trichuris suis]|uniref:Peptidase A2 domain-containing protein n=1 Tax=Trichuris suis TaxID=68888 RepID=A0A085N4N4_9BILA|nr:hypothetical protein M514_04346 [Trichuris suis]